MNISNISKATLFALTLLSLRPLSASIETRNLIIDSPSFIGEGMTVLGECTIGGSAFLSKAHVLGSTSIEGCFFAQDSKFKDITINASFFDENHDGVKNIVSQMESGVDVTLAHCTVEDDMTIIGARNTILTDCRVKNVTIKPKDLQKKAKNNAQLAQEQLNAEFEIKVVKNPVVEPQILDLRGKKSKVQGVITFEGGNGIVLINKKIKTGKKLKITGGRVQYLK